MRLVVKRVRNSRFEPHKRLLRRGHRRIDHVANARPAG
jgi:hypothetical protein